MSGVGPQAVPFFSGKQIPISQTQFLLKNFRNSLIPRVVGVKGKWEGSWLWLIGRGFCWVISRQWCLLISASERMRQDHLVTLCFFSLRYLYSVSSVFWSLLLNLWASEELLPDVSDHSGIQGKWSCPVMSIYWTHLIAHQRKRGKRGQHTKIWHAKSDLQSATKSSKG